MVGQLPSGITSTTVVGYIAEAIAGLGIADYAKTTEVTAAISSALASYYTKTDIDNKLASYVLKTDIETVSHRLGHSKASTTLDIYGHAMKKMDSKASDTLESILSNRKKA